MEAADSTKDVTRATGEAFRVAGLFAGIGGLELGLARAGHETSLLCENDRGAAQVLRTRFAGVSLEHDVRELRPQDLPGGAVLLTAGFPCQDLSQAGATAGIDGRKSSLVGEVFRLLRRRRVAWVLLENVPFMLHLARGRAMDRVVTALEALGYRWAYRVVDSMAFGLPQRRRRVFLVASLVGHPADVLLADDVTAPEDPAWGAGRALGFYWTEGNRGVGWAVDSVPTLKGGSGLGIPSAPAVLRPDGHVVTPALSQAERLQGFHADWSKPAESAVPRRFRWRMVGNAVNVRAAQWIGDRLAKPGAFDQSRLGRRLDGAGWPGAACNLGDGRRAVEIGEWPRRRRIRSVLGFVDDGQPLSARATGGFVFRAERAVREGNLKFPEGFLPRLHAHLERVRVPAI